MITLTELGRVHLNPSLEMNPQLAYLLGILRGDGWVGGRASKFEISTSTDAALADEVVELFTQVGLHPRKRHIDQSKYCPNSRGYYKVTVYSKKMAEWLNTLSLDKLIEVLRGNLLLLRRFWEGMFEAEGYVYKQRQLHIANTNKELLQWGKSVLSNLGYHPTLYPRMYADHPNWKPLYRLCLYRKVEIREFLAEHEQRLEVE
jgi:hypothetical protein